MQISNLIEPDKNNPAVNLSSFLNHYVWQVGIHFSVVEQGTKCIVSNKDILLVLQGEKVWLF